VIDDINERAESFGFHFLSEPDVRHAQGFESIVRRTPRYERWRSAFERALAERRDPNSDAEITDLWVRVLAEHPLHGGSERPHPAVAERRSHEPAVTLANTERWRMVVTCAVSRTPGERSTSERRVRLGHVLAVLLASAFLAACAGSGSTATGFTPPAACVTTAREDGGTVAAAFPSTVGAIRRLPIVNNNPQLSGFAADEPATVCYVDGQIAKGPPPPDDATATIPPSFDRAVLVVVGHAAIFIAAGYRQNLPVQAP
jgi:hypothetical protein